VVPHGRLNNITLIPTIKEDIIAAQRTDVGMDHLRQRMELGEAQCFRQDTDGVLWFKNCLVVPKDFDLRRKIMDEAHCSWYSIHPGTNKMYQDLKKNFWWTRMKREIVKYVLECDSCRRSKADHLRPARNLQHLSIPEWKWENICMDFIVHLPRTSCGYNSIWVIVDHFVKVVLQNFHRSRYRSSPLWFFLWGRHLASWLLALGERGGHGDLHGSGCLSVIPYIHGRTELYCAQDCLA
jgi:hypothetical protein